MSEFTVNEPSDRNRSQQPSMRMPILIGAIVTAGISLIPFASLTCCLPMIFGGLLATFLYSRGLTSPMAMSKGITIGLITALLGGILTVLIIDIVWLTQGYQMGAEAMKETALWIASLAGEEAVETVREELEATGEQQLTPAAFAMQIASTATISAIGGLISGSLGAALFKGGRGNPGGRLED
jgi:hypothetical protein